MINTKKPLSLSAEEIANWESNDKKKRVVHFAEFRTQFNGSGIAKFWMVKPDRTTINAVTETGKTSLSKANDLVLNSCILAGDTDMLEADDDLYYAVIKEIGELYDTAKKI